MRTNKEPIAAPCSRRSFLRSTGLLAAGAALGGPAVVPDTVFGANAPGNRITMAFIGVGRQTFGSNIPEFMAVPGVQVVAVCDVDAWRLGEAKKLVETSYAKQAPSGNYAGCAAYRDFLMMPGSDQRPKRPTRSTGSTRVTTSRAGLAGCGGGSTARA